MLTMISMRCPGASSVVSLSERPSPPIELGSDQCRCSSPILCVCIHFEEPWAGGGLGNWESRPSKSRKPHVLLPSSDATPTFMPVPVPRTVTNVMRCSPSVIRCWPNASSGRSRDEHVRLCWMTPPPTGRMRAHVSTAAASGGWLTVSVTSSSGRS